MAGTFTHVTLWGDNHVEETGDYDVRELRALIAGGTPAFKDEDTTEQLIIELAGGVTPAAEVE